MIRRKIPEVLTKDEQQALIDKFNERYPTSHRNKMLADQANA